MTQSLEDVVRVSSVEKHGVENFQAKMKSRAAAGRLATNSNYAKSYAPGLHSEEMQELKLARRITTQLGNVYR